MQEPQETQIRSLGQEDPLEKEMATHSSILAWEIPWTEEPGGLQSMRSQRVRHDWGDWECTYTLWNDHCSKFRPYTLLMFILHPQELFIMQLEVCTPSSPWPTLPTLQFPSLLAITYLFSLWVYFHFGLSVLFLDPTYKWDHEIFVFLYLTNFP